MSSIQQPQIANDFGAVLSVGIVNGADRMEIVLPVFTDDTTLDEKTLCQDAVQSFRGTILSLLEACMSMDAYVSFSAADGMRDGNVPFREDYVPGVDAGTRAAGTLPDNTAALIIFYEDPLDISPAGTKIRVGKNFIPAIPQTDVSGDRISGGLQTALQALADGLQNGWPGVVNSSNSWYRGLAVPKPRTTTANVKRVTAQQVRGYVGTQRRRMIPH